MVCAALARRFGPGRFDLVLNKAEIHVEARDGGDRPEIVLRSPPTWRSLAPKALLAETLRLFGLEAGALAPTLAPRLAHAGADHLILPLQNRADLAAMRYDLDTGRAFMARHGLETVALVVSTGPQLIQARNAFASGGGLEDPATGAAAAAFAGMLRDAGWPHGGRVDIRQGEDMGAPSHLTVRLSATPGDPVAVSGQVVRLA